MEKDKTAEQEFEEFLKSAYPKGISKDQAHDLRIFFYAGACTVVVRKFDSKGLNAYAKECVTTFNAMMHLAGKEN